MRLCVAAFVSVTFVLVAGCSPRHPATVTWTVDGADPAEACDPVGDQVRVNVSAQDAVDGDAMLEEPVEVDCATGTADVGLGSFNTVFAEILRGGEVVGRSDLVEVTTTGGAIGAINPLSGNVLIDLDVNVELGFMEIGFTAVQEDCEHAGVGAIDLIINRQITGLDREVVVDESVSCDGYLFEGAKVGETYLISAQSSIEGVDFGTSGSGHRVVMERSVLSTTVNLIENEIPDTAEGS